MIRRILCALGIHGFSKPDGIIQTGRNTWHGRAQCQDCGRFYLTGKVK